VVESPHDRWTALCAATRQLLVTTRIDAAQIAAVSFSGQIHTLVLLDAQCVPVRPAISWADTCGSDERKEIEGRIGRTRLIEITGSPAVTAFTATKLLWVRRHEQEVWPRARGHALQRSLALAAHGHGGDRSDGRWRHGIVGYARAGVGVTGARRIGHTPRPPAPDRSIDCDPGHRPMGRVHALPHALADHWHILAAIPAAGLALGWAGRVLAVPREPGEPLSTGPPIFVPDVAGARTPLMDEQARGSFVGLALDHTARDLSFAAHEGVAFALRGCVETLDELGVPSDPLLVTGGLSVNEDFLPLLADVLNRPLQRASHAEGSGWR